MTGNVSFNPFNGNPFTDIEIQYLDLNKDGKISQSEFNQGISSWLTGGQDIEGDVNIGGDDNLFNRVKSNGGKDTAKTQAEFKEQMALVIDEYMEMYFTQNTGLSDSERKAIQNLIKQSGNTFITEKLAENPNGPWDIKQITTEFINHMEQTILKNQKLANDMNSAIDGYKNATDGNLESLLKLVAEANTNGNISTAEFNKIKNKIVQYLLGTMLNGEVDTELLNSINPNYAKSSYYKAAMDAIKELESCSDPVKMQQLLNTAIQNITKMIESFGSDKVTKGVANYQDAKEKAELTSKLEKTADQYIEQNINASMSDSEKEQLKTFVDTCMTKFIEQLIKSGSWETLTDSQIQEQFKAFIDEQKAKLEQTQTTLSRSVGDADAKHQSLITISDNANKNGNISDDEKAAIISAANGLIINQLLNGMDDIPFLEGLNANYKNTAEYKEILNIVGQLKTCMDPEELVKLQTQLNEALTNMLNKYTGEQLVKAVDSTKPIVVDDKTKDSAIYNSEIGNDYAAGVTRRSDRGTDKDDMTQIIEMAKQDMMAFAQQMKAQLKAQLGTAYNEAEIDKWIQDAINDTIVQFSENSITDNRHQHYDKGNNARPTEMCFVYNDRTHSKRDQWLYNVKALIDAFVINFNKVSKEKSAVQNDPTKATYDKENVIMDSIGSDYLNREHIKKSDTAENRVTLLNEAKAKLTQIAAALKSSLIAEGCPLNGAEIDEIIDQAMQNSLNKSIVETYDLMNNKRYINLNYKGMTEQFFHEFDKLYAEKLKDK